VTTLPRYGRRRFRCLDLLFAPLWNLVIAGSGTARGRHDRDGLGKAKLKVRGEVGNALGSEYARYLNKNGEGVTPDISVTNFRIVSHHGSCRSGSWEELMEHIADVRQPTSHDDSGSYDGGDSEVKMTRLATGTLLRLPRGNKTQSSASFKEAAHRLAATIRVTSGTGPPQDGRRSFARLNLND
jgi:hypothetical protein